MQATTIAGMVHQVTMVLLLAMDRLVALVIHQLAMDRHQAMRPHQGIHHQVVGHRLAGSDHLRHITGGRALARLIGMSRT